MKKYLIIVRATQPGEINTIPICNGTLLRITNKTVKELYLEAHDERRMKV